MSPTIFNVVVYNVRQRGMILCRLFGVVRIFWFQMRRVWLIPNQQPAGGRGGKGQKGGCPEQEFRR